MRIVMDLQIHYHDKGHASVFLEPTTSAGQERFGEVVLWSLFTVRILCDLGLRQKAAVDMAELLASGDAMVSPSVPDLVEHESTGDKGFIAKLNATDASLDQSLIEDVVRTQPEEKVQKFLITLIEPDFDVTVWGFKHRDRRGDYEVRAPLILLRYLILRRETDDEYVAALSEAAATLGFLFREWRNTVK